jgi:hypothetical protein
MHTYKDQHRHAFRYTTAPVNARVELGRHHQLESQFSYYVRVQHLLKRLLHDQAPKKRTYLGE